jgi:hypothetical protein
MVRTFLKVYMELGSYFLFLQEQIKDIIIISSTTAKALCTHESSGCNSEASNRAEKAHTERLRESSKHLELFRGCIMRVPAHSTALCLAEACCRQGLLWTTL